jgi:hypothetical protein
MVAKANEINVNPVEYLEMMNALGDAGFELVAIHHDCLIFKRCLDTAK